MESRHGDGTYVTSLEPMLLAAPIDFLLRVDEGGLGALTDARMVLESGIAQLAASRATPEGIGRLEALIADYADCIDDIPRCIELDLAFHQELAVVADSPILSSLVTTLAALGRQSRTQTAPDAKLRPAANGEHAAIAKAVAIGDAAAARAAMVSHLSHVKESAALELAADWSARMRAREGGGGRSGRGGRREGEREARPFHGRPSLGVWSRLHSGPALRPPVSAGPRAAASPLTPSLP